MLVLYRYLKINFMKVFQQAKLKSKDFNTAIRLDGDINGGGIVLYVREDIPDIPG